MVYQTFRIKELLSTLAVRDRIPVILRALSELLSMQALLYLLDKENHTINLIEGAGKGWEDARKTYPFEGSIHGLCIKEQKVLEVGGKGKPLRKGIEDEELKGFKRVIYLPIGGGVDRFSGCLCVKGKMNRGLTLKEKRILKTLSLYLTDTLSFQEGLDRCERKVRKLVTLYELSRAVMLTVDMERLLYIILTAITAGEGLGFNRAMLFMVDDKGERLQGMMGIGPDSPEEAERIWDETRRKDLNLWRLISDEERHFPAASNRFDEIVKSLSIDLEEDSILSRTVKEMKPFNVTDAGILGYTCNEIVERLGCNAFASLPIIAGKRVVGVIVVDNLYNQRPITEEDIDILMAFCRQAGLAIDNSLLYNRLKEMNKELLETQARLIHNEKMVAMGKMAAVLAHEIKNPVVSIGGFVRRLKRDLNRGLRDGYLDRIDNEASRLERILSDILAFSRWQNPDLKELSINAIISETLGQFEDDFRRSNIEVIQDIVPEIPPILADRGQMSEVFVNLFSNAVEAMKHGGRLKVKSRPVVEGDNLWVVVDIEDTGGGIPPDVIGNIFNPFFTTKEHGTGLGLPIVHTIITNHRGSIEVNNINNHGVVFSLKLPALKKGCVQSLKE